MTPKKPKELATVESELRKIQSQIAREDKNADKDEAQVLKELLAGEESKRNQRDVNDMRVALHSPECRRVINRIIEVSKCFAPSFSSDALLMAKNEGERAIGIFIYTLAESAEPGICLRMAREADSDRVAREMRNKKIIGGINE